MWKAQSRFGSCSVQHLEDDGDIKEGENEAGTLILLVEEWLFVSASLKLVELTEGSSGGLGAD